ncbi:hypothetical protein V8D89_001271 [Ganoderma adspersum]
MWATPGQLQGQDLSVPVNDMISTWTGSQLSCADGINSIPYSGIIVFDQLATYSGPISKHGSPSVADKDELARQKKAKHNAARAKHSDYGSDATFSEVMQITAHSLSVHFATEKPYPSKGACKKLIEDKYKLLLEECSLEPTQYPLSDDQMTLLEKEEREQDMHTALIHRLLGATEENQQTRKSIFEYKNITSKEDWFQHPIIPDVLYEAFFKHDGALTCTNQSSFNPIHHQTLALVLTAIEHCIEQYISGTYDKHLKFSKDYYRMYDRHFNILEQYTALEWKQYRKLLFRKRLAHANVQKLDVPPPTLEVVAAEEIDADMACLAAD